MISSVYVRITSFILFGFSFMATAYGAFSDVPSTHPYKGAIDELSSLQVVRGYSDGTFHPEKSVNRAEMMKLLYSATGKIPSSGPLGCFKDVVRESWYEAIVCDAASSGNRFVQGYSNGTFRPAATVSRVEAIAMIMKVFEFSVPAMTEESKRSIAFVDVSTSAWYAAPVSYAFQLGLLPINGSSSAYFYPNAEVSRGEASQLIWNAIQAKNRQAPVMDVQQESSASSVAQAVSSISSSQSSIASVVSKNVTFPFADRSTFTNKTPSTYIFDIASSTKFMADVRLIESVSGTVSCRLYLLGSDGFSEEYYLGVQSGQRCLIVSTLRPGHYQLQLQPSIANASFMLDTSIPKGDTNDGFIEAIRLKPTTPKTATLESGDMFDWYTFTMTSTTSGTLSVISADPLRCIIYTPSSVDQFGFEGPQCNKQYQYEVGVQYTVGIGRKDGSEFAQKYSYTVLWK